MKRLPSRRPPRPLPPRAPLWLLVLALYAVVILLACVVLELLERSVHAR